MASPAAIDSAEISRLHLRALAGDETAREQLAAALLAKATRILLRVSHRRDPGDVEDAVERAISGYFANPASFDPSRLSLTTYIANAALRNLADRDRAERRRRRREAMWIEEQTRQADAVRCGLDDIWPLLLAGRGPLTDDQWTQVAPLFPERLHAIRGRPIGPPRSILDSVIAVLRAGGRWQELQATYPPWQTCYRHFRVWCRSGALRRAVDRLEADLRCAAVKTDRTSDVAD